MILEKYKEICSSLADEIDGFNWREISKSDLINKFIDVQNSNPYLANQYMAALICRYWDVISIYYRFNSHIASPEICFDWVIMAILYTVSKRKWKDPHNKLYNDKNAPDKVVNIRAKAERLTYYQYIQYGTRKANYITQSIDDYFKHEDYNDNFLELYEIDNWIKKLVKDLMQKDSFLGAFIIDGVINSNVFLKKSSIDTRIVFKKSALKKHLLNLTESYKDTFCKLYDQPRERVDEAVFQINKIPLKSFTSRINIEFEKIRKILHLYLDKDVLSRYEQK